MRKKASIILFILAILVGMAFLPSFALGAPVTVQNPGFEEENAGFPSMWSKYDWKASEGSTSFRQDLEVRHSGSSSALIDSPVPNDARFKQEIPCGSDMLYKISCWVRTENVGNDAKGANLSVDGITGTSDDLRGTGDWKLLEFYGKSGKNQKSFVLTLGLGGYGSLNSGKAWFDDVSVEETENLPEGRNAVNLFVDPQGDNNGSDADSPKEDSSITGGNSLLVKFLIFLAFAAGLTAAVFYYYKRWKGARTARYIETPVTRLLFDRKDLLIAGSMTLVYLIVALVNLGSLKGPQTWWKPGSSGDSITVDFGRQVAIGSVYAIFGLGRGEFLLEYVDETGGYTALCTIPADNYLDVFKWKSIDVAASTEKVRITVQSPGAAANEFSFIDSATRKPIVDFRITDIAVKPGGDGTPEALLDEQAAVPDKPSFMNSTYFDEIYHARTAFEHLHKIEPYESTHPPLGKVLIALGISLFGMTGFGWRIVGTLFGAAMIPAMYVFGKRMFGKRFPAFCSAFLMMFDFMHFAQTRIATIDVYVTFFVILMFYFMYDYFMNKSYMTGFRQSLKPLFLCGLFFGLGIASKWIALYGAAGLALLFAVAKLNETMDYRILSFSKREKPAWYSRFLPWHIGGTVLACMIFFILIPIGLYILSYIPFMQVPGPGHGLGDLWPYQVHMYNYHKNLHATHSFASPWWQWPFMIRPLWFYSGSGLPAGTASTMVTMGNPAVWWAGIVAVVSAAWIGFKKKDKRILLILVAIAAQYLPWVLVPRIAFIYHYFSIVPFVILAIVYVLTHWMAKYAKAKYWVYAYLALALLLFAWFYPALSGLEVSWDYISHLRWFPTWTF